MRPILAALGAVLLASSGAEAALQVAEVVEPPDTGIEYTDHYFVVTDPGVWEAMVDAATGAVFSLEDLTDPGLDDGQGGRRHVNYTGTATSGTDYCYHIRCPLFSFCGRSGDSCRIFTRKYAVAGLADRLSFALAADGNSFIITYSEDAGSQDFLWDPSTVDVVGGPAGSPGDVLTTITLTLNAAGTEGTVFRMVAQSTIALEPGQVLPGCVFEGGHVAACIRSAQAYVGYDYWIDQSLDADASRVDGPWDDAAPRSFIRRTVSDTANNRALGLTPGRTFVLDRVAGFEGHPCGGEFEEEVLACGQHVRQFTPFALDDLPAGTVRTEVMDLRIDIACDDPSDPLEISAAFAPGEDWVYQNTAATTQDRHASALTITLVSEAQPGESYTVSIGEGGGVLANFTTAATGDPLVIDVVGGRADTTVPSAPASYTLSVTVTGESSGQFDTANVDLRLCPIGDLTGDGFVNAVDKVHMNAWLNGMPLPGDTIRHVDLTGDGYAGAIDKVQITRVLNGLGVL